MTDTFQSPQFNYGTAAMSMAKKGHGTAGGKGVARSLQGDPELVDRLKRAVGAYQLRTGQTVTWKELGELAELTPSSMTDVLAVRKRVTIEEARIWSKKLGVAFAWLAIGDGPMIEMTPEEARRFGTVPEAGESAAALFARRRAEAQKPQPRPGSKGR